MTNAYGSRGPFAPLIRPQPSNTRQVPIYLPALILMAVMVGIVFDKSQTISNTIASQVNQELKRSPRLAALADIQGRDLILEGEISPFPGLNEALQNLSSIRGLRRLDDRLERVVLEAPHLELKRSDDSVIVIGRLNQQDFDSVIAEVNDAFPYLPVQDKVQIDDVIGSPLWIEGFANSLRILGAVDDLEVNGWRDRLQLNGSVSSNHQKRLGRSVAASLMHQVDIDNRIIEKTASDYPFFAISTNQYGLELTASVIDNDIASQIQQQAEAVFGPVIGNIDLDPKRQNQESLVVLLELLPELAVVKKLRLTSTGKRYVMWGEVATPNHLGKIIRHVDKLGLSQKLDNKIAVATSGRPAVLTMLRYHDHLAFSGLMPNASVRKQVTDAAKQAYGIDLVEDDIKTHEQVDYSTWMEVWPEVLESISLDVFGIAVDGSYVYLTGMAETVGQHIDIERRVAELLTDYEVHNWMIASNR